MMFEPKSLEQSTPLRDQTDADSSDKDDSSIQLYLDDGLARYVRKYWIDGAQLEAGSNHQRRWNRAGAWQLQENSTGLQVRARP